MVYIREAHPDDGWRSPANLIDEITFNQPVTQDARHEMAEVCQITLGLNLPMVVDGIDNEVEEKYIAKPERLYVIDKDGYVVFNGVRGPEGFDPDLWEAATKQQLQIQG